jgi:hypothetical protein
MHIEHDTDSGVFVHYPYQTSHKFNVLSSHLTTDANFSVKRKKKINYFGNSLVF